MKTPMQDSDWAHRPPFFDTQKAEQYVQLPGTTFLVRRANVAGGPVTDQALAAKWREKQAQFIKWTQDQVMFNEADVAYNSANYARFFSTWHGLRGRVLDVGGGWGLFRKWWEPSADGCFVVHDPAPERFTLVPPDTLKRHYGTGLAKPGWFVEGFGEDLPYCSGTYDVVLIGAALDHCADPAQVLLEACRVLRPGGTLLIIQGCEPERGAAPRGAGQLWTRLLKLLADPRRLHRAIRLRLFHRGDPHLHHFNREGLHHMLRSTGFERIADTIIDQTYSVFAFEGSKPRSGVRGSS
jgi:ubiquinone/menaquinone biosynthesis C-methylase UbiE